MRARVSENSSRPGPFLSRLRRNVAGTTLAMMAMALIPVSALAGSAVDMARLYVVKVRLQQACDAGVLAGRKFMETSDAPTLDANAAAQARTFFRNNFNAGWMRTNAVNFTPTKSANQQVAGTATATVPMTIMKMFNAADVQLNVTCEAIYDVPDVDVMFVLDTTGSMACAANEPGGCGQANRTYTRANGTTGYFVEEKATSKIRGLRAAVLNFHDTLIANAEPTTNIRYGFVPYSSTVNVGREVMRRDASFMNTEVTHTSREYIGDGNGDDTYNRSVGGISEADCRGSIGFRSPGTGYPAERVETFVSWTQTSAAGITPATGTCAVTTRELLPLWHYRDISRDFTGYLAGNAVADPTKLNGGPTRWQGCIEERPTVATATIDPNALPPDLDPDLPPNSEPTRWRAMWPEVIYRRSFLVQETTTRERANNGSADEQSRGFAACPRAAQRLARMTRTEINTYLTHEDFRPLGGTYHDTGMIWGTRFLSPSGPFAADTAAHPGRNPPNRHLIFMTDGDMAPNRSIYGMYGLETYNRRVTGGDYDSITARHNARFTAVCQAAQARNITVWVIAFGQAMTTDLRNCATTPVQAIFASNNDELDDAFRRIAEQIAMLRVSG